MSDATSTDGGATGVTLVELTKENYRAYLDLRVKPDQKGFVASNEWSVAQAYFQPKGRFFGIASGRARRNPFIVHSDSAIGAWKKMENGKWNCCLYE